MDPPLFIFFKQLSTPSLLRQHPACEFLFSYLLQCFRFLTVFVLLFYGTLFTSPSSPCSFSPSASWPLRLCLMNPTFPSLPIAAFLGLHHFSVVSSSQDHTELLIAFKHSACMPTNVPLLYNNSIILSSQSIMAIPAEMHNLHFCPTLAALKSRKNIHHFKILFKILCPVSDFQSFGLYLWERQHEPLLRVLQET